jgi:hypothetical protein
MNKVFCKMINGKVCLNTAVMADVLGIEQRTLQEWSTRECPKEARGWWSIKDVLTWRGLLTPGGLKTDEQAEEVSISHKKLTAEATLKDIKAKEAQLKLSIVQDEYISKEEITAELQRFFVVIKRSMLGYSRMIGTEISPFVDPVNARRIEKMITELTLDALEQISIDGVYKPPKKKAKA